jgi:hypothetical protein
MNQILNAHVLYPNVRHNSNMRNRKKRLIRLFVMIGVLLTTSSCFKGQTNSPKIMNKITELKEFKAEEKRIDSLKQTGRKVDITISIINNSFDPEDKGKNISTAFINEDLGFDETILYEVKFNSKTEEIISIKSNKKD